MLLQIRDYIKREQMVSTQQLSREFHIDEQALEPMLALWEKKGIIRQCQAQACNQGCVRCNVKTPIFYQFIRA